MNTRKLMAAAVLAVSVAALPILADPHAKARARNDGGWSSEQVAQFNQYFTQFDRNGNGVISRDEFPADVTLFNRLDLNRDGFLTRGEIATAVPNRQAAEGLARGYDRNGDGVITRNEFPGNDVAFARLDRNRDGVITSADHAGKGHGKAEGKAKRNRD